MIGRDGGRLLEGERVIHISRAVHIRAAACIAVVVCLSIVWGRSADATGTVDVTPVTELTDGASVTVTASGFGANGLGAITQCNDAAGQPTIAVAGMQVPVSCSDPFKKLVNYDAAG